MRTIKTISRINKTTALLALSLLLMSACQTPKKRPIDYVNPFIGTGGHGHTYPGATCPFGAVQLSPDTRKGDWDACAGYHFSDSTLYGFSHTHLSGTGCIDLGDLLFRPTSEPFPHEAADKKLYSPTRFFHRNETAKPGYYSVYLDEEEIQVELSTTTHAGIHRYTFSPSKNAGVIIDLAHLLDDEHIYEAKLQQTGVNTLSGMRRTRGWVDNQYIFFYIEFSEPIQDFYTICDGVVSSKSDSAIGTTVQAFADFGKKEIVIAKVGISIVSEDNARENLEKEIPGFDFDTVVTQAEALWEKALSVVEVEGGTDAQKTNFYTAWYHAMVVPNVVSDVNGTFRKHDMSIGKVSPSRRVFSTFSTWDTFRAWHPLMTLVDTILVNDMIRSLLDVYETTGELPIWSLSAGETYTMIGYHSTSIIADAYMKGIRGYDAEKVIEAMVKSSEINKKGASYYIQEGFIPGDIRKESVSCLLEFAYDDWTIAQMAKAMGLESVYRTYIDRSQNYINVFDGSSRFFRGKRRDGNWVQKFNPYEVGRDYTEATAWQYRFFVPHDINGLIQQFGGVDYFEAALDSLFTTRSEIDGNLSDISGLLGQYAHGNEPSHHMAYLYNFIGKPWRTQELTRRLLEEMYSPNPDGLIGNEDCGQMSAWYIMSAMGFYPLCPGSNEFVLTAPLFKSVRLALANGKNLFIKANSSPKNVFINQVTLNGRIISKNIVTYAELMEGGTLEFHLSDHPNDTRGTAHEDLPYSFTTDPVVAIPYIHKDLSLFLETIDVPIGCTTPDTRIYYTTDGTEPTPSSALYTEPIHISETTLIKARAYKEGYMPSRILSIQATKAHLSPAIAPSGTTPGTLYRYYEGIFQSVSDISEKHQKKSGLIPEPSITNASINDHFAYIFEGLIDVPEDGVYTFATKSDDGSVLYIDDKKVVDNDGSHAAVRATGRIPLQKGLHKYRLLYFEDYEGEELLWEWQIPSASELTKIPANRLFIK